MIKAIDDLVEKFAMLHARQVRHVLPYRQFGAMYPHVLRENAIVPSATAGKALLRSARREILAGEPADQHVRGR